MEQANRLMQQGKSEEALALLEEHCPGRSGAARGRKANRHRELPEG